MKFVVDRGEFDELGRNSLEDLFVRFEVLDSLDCELHLDFLCVTGGVGVKRFGHCI